MGGLLDRAHERPRCLHKRAPPAKVARTPTGACSRGYGILRRTDARSASSTTACSRTPSAAPSAGTATSPSGWPPTGHEVTYLTLRQWDRGERPGVPGVDVRVVGPRMALYDGPGHRRILPPLVFGAGVLWHLLRHGRRYDVVHTCSFPYFSLLAAALVRAARAATASSSTGSRSGAATTGASTSAAAGDGRLAVQRLCARVRQRAFCFSRLYAERLRAEGLRGEITMLARRLRRPAGAAGRGRRPSRWSCSPGATSRRSGCRRSSPAIARAARADARAARRRSSATVPSARRRARRSRALGPRARSSRSRASSPADEVEDAIARALCLLLPSRREGYGLVVVEAAAHGTPSVVVAGPDNAAVELIEEGVNGFVAASAGAEDLAAAIVAVAAGGERAARVARARWFAANAERLSLDALAGDRARDLRGARARARSRRASPRAVALPAELAPRARGPAARRRVGQRARRRAGG